MRRRKSRGPKRVPYRLIEADSKIGKYLYGILRKLLKDEHHEIREARIALAWHAGWKSDVDGRRKLACIRKCGDLDRELQSFDAVIVLNRDFFEQASVTDAQRTAIIDHELCHLTRKLDTNLEPMVDERGRPVYRMVKHDIEEFGAIVERYGCYKSDIETFYRKLKRAKSLPLLEEPPVEAKAPTNGNGHQPDAVDEGEFGAEREAAIDDVETARTIAPRHASAADRAKAKQRGTRHPSVN